MFERTIEISTFCDASSAISAIRKGGTEGQLRYLPKYPGISISFLHDVFYCDNNGEINADLIKIDSINNPADVLTKPLDAESFNRHRSWIGVRIKQHSQATSALMWLRGSMKNLTLEL